MRKKKYIILFATLRKEGGRYKRTVQEGWKERENKGIDRVKRGENRGIY